MKKYLLLLLTASSLTQAATFNVSTTAELRVALSTAATNNEDDTIILADGTYKTTDDGGGTFLYLSDEDNLLTLEGATAENVVLDGDSQHQILNHVTSGDAKLVLNDLSFKNAVHSANGGAVFASYSVDITRGIFDNNTSSQNGGAVYSERTITGYAKDAPIITVNNSVFTNNSANSGGALWGRNIDINGTTFSDNSASDGGAIMAYDPYRIGQVIDTIFNNNQASNKGGGLYSARESFIIKDSTFTANSAEYGGGFYSRSVLLTDSVINKNTSVLGGAGFATAPGTGVKSTVTNTRISNNINSGDGSFGLYCGGGFYSRIVAVYNSIIQDNTSTVGGAFCAQYDVDIINTLVLNNSSGVDIASDYDGNDVVNSIFINNGTEFTRNDVNEVNSIVKLYGYVLLNCCYTVYEYSY